MYLQYNCTSQYNFLCLYLHGSVSVPVSFSTLDQTKYLQWSSNPNLSVWHCKIFGVEIKGCTILESRGSLWCVKHTDSVSLGKGLKSFFCWQVCSGKKKTLFIFMSLYIFYSLFTLNATKHLGKHATDVTLCCGWLTLKNICLAFEVQPFLFSVLNTKISKNWGFHVSCPILISLFSSKHKGSTMKAGLASGQ